MRVLAVIALLVTLSSAANATTCTQAIGRCKQEGAQKPNIERKCEAAGSACMKNGVFVGPITGKVWKNVGKR